jgi:uncharacterized coiled-coil DUF342 family protein
MGFLDKVKEAGKDMADAAKKGAAQVKEKVDKGQIRKKADELAKQLGYLIVKERHEGTPAGAEGDRLVSEIVELEEQLAAAEAAEAGASSAPPEAASGSAGEASPPPASGPEPAAGDFKLD